jgi:hypothetical protein
MLLMGSDDLASIVDVSQRLRYRRQKNIKKPSVSSFSRWHRRLAVCVAVIAAVEVVAEPLVAALPQRFPRDG